MSEQPRGWPLLHSKLPPRALRPISTDVYGVAGLTDVNEGYLIQRLFASELAWDWKITDQSYLGFEDRQPKGKDYTNRYYLASVQGILVIDGREFHGSGAHDNRKIDAAFKGAATVAFKNAAKMAGLFAELLLDGRAMDFIYEGRDGKIAASEGGAGALASPHEADDTAIQAPPSEEVIEEERSNEEPQEGVLAAPPDQGEQGERPEATASGMIGTSAMTPASPAQGAAVMLDRHVDASTSAVAQPSPAQGPDREGSERRSDTAPGVATPSVLGSPESRQGRSGGDEPPPLTTKHRGRPKGSKNKPKNGEPVSEPTPSLEAAPESAPSLVDSADGAVAPLPPSPLIDDGLEPLRSEVLVKATELRRLQFQKKQKQAALAGQRIEVPEGDDLVKAGYEGLTLYIERKFGTDVKLPDLERIALEELRNELAQFAASLAAPVAP